jgi:hypothetical protein
MYQLAYLPINLLTYLLTYLFTYSMVKESVQVRGALKHFVRTKIFAVKGF